MYKLIASDLDETLLQTNKHTGPYTISRIKEAIDKGLCFVCATGRNHVSIRPTLDELELYNKKDTYTISLNGAVVTENYQSRILYTEPMDWEIVNHLYKFGKQYDVCIHVYSVDKVYAWNVNQNERDFCEGRMELIEFDTEDLEFLKDETMIKILFQNMDFDYLKSIENDLDDETKALCDISFSSNRYIEFNKAGVNKGKGIRFLSEYLNIPIEETMAIGDNYNDLPMLIEAGLGVGVKNTNPRMVDEVDLIVPWTNDEDAVGHIIDEYFLNAK